MRIPQREVLSVTLFLVAINVILREFRNEWMDNLAIYITTRNQRVGSRALQGVTNKLNAWAAERGLSFSFNKTVSMMFIKRNEEPREIMLRDQIIPYR